MKLSLIWAMDHHRLIGHNNMLPWKLPADMAWFRQHTMGKPILMGRKTYDSIGKPLPGRSNLILTRQKKLTIEGCTVVHSLDEAKHAALDAKEIMVIGGAEIYNNLLPEADRLYVTHIQHSFEGDAWFPAFEQERWRETHMEEHQPNEKNMYAYSFHIFERC